MLIGLHYSAAWAFGMYIKLQCFVLLGDILGWKVVQPKPDQLGPFPPGLLGYTVWYWKDNHHHPAYVHLPSRASAALSFAAFLCRRVTMNWYFVLFPWPSGLLFFVFKALGLAVHHKGDTSLGKIVPLVSKLYHFLSTAMHGTPV